MIGPDPSNPDPQKVKYGPAKLSGFQSNVVERTNGKSWSLEFLLWFYL